MGHDEFVSELSAVMSELTALLTSKNKRYGNSALEPLRIFSRVGNDEQINVRIDDKLSRIKNRPLGDDFEDSELDLIGYLIIRRMSRRRNERQTARSSHLSEY